MCEAAVLRLLGASSAYPVRLELPLFMTQSELQVSVSSDCVHDRLMAACGYPVTIAPDTADMPEEEAIPARAPIAAELCEIPVQVTLQSRIGWVTWRCCWR